MSKAILVVFSALLLAGLILVTYQTSGACPCSVRKETLQLQFESIEVDGDFAVDKSKFDGADGRLQFHEGTLNIDGETRAFNYF